MSGHGTAPDGRRGGLLAAGDTCWRIERAERLSVIVDGADYFRHLRSALRQAERTIYMIGWDLDLRLEMIPGESDEDGDAPDGMPNRLGEFLKHIVATAPDVLLYILKWDKAMLVQLSQQLAETTSLKLASSRIHFALDSHHPTGATHHQKIVVVDDRLAFCGGIDVTGGRWDTREHAPGNERRHFPGGKIAKPWHDVTTALLGPVATALGDLSRARWHAATGDELEPPTASTEPWPDGLDVELTGVEIGIARTEPEYRGQELVNEIERLHLAAIRAARRTIYLESQYFASGSICRALEERMAEPDGPELVVVNPDRAEGFLQHQSMDTARARMIERVRGAARRGGGGFRIYYPVNSADEPIYVHAKVLIVDDALVRIGSSNVNNRSMGFDTECDVVLEPADEAQRAFALRLRHSLLAEHLGCETEEVADAVSAHGSLIGAIEALNGRSERRLHAIDEVPSNEARREIGERILFDERLYPRNLPRPLRSVSHGAKRAIAPYHFEAVGAGALIVGAAALGIGLWAGVRLARERAEARRPLPAPAVIVRPRASPARGPAPAAARGGGDVVAVALAPDRDEGGGRVAVIAAEREPRP